MMGGFALAGMPLTAQFASRWALFQLVAENDPRWVLLLLLGATGCAGGHGRAPGGCFGRLRFAGANANRRAWRWCPRAGRAASCSGSSPSC